MKKVTMIAAALLCAYFLTAGIASAAQRTPVAGFSPSLAAPQPATKATLTTDANRLIRWQGWLDIDAFSASILEQMQKQVESGDIEVGLFTIAEPAIEKAVSKAKEDKNIKDFVMNENLNEGMGEKLTNPKLYVWTYRHNYTDTGLYQLYVSVKGKVFLGTGLRKITDPGLVVPHRDIQSLGYEFGDDDYIRGRDRWESYDVFADNIEIWRGAVVRVNARGVLELVGNEAGVVVGPLKDESVEAAPISDWERAPSLEGNPNYNPKRATGPAYVEPLERAKAIESNTDQKATGSVPKVGGDRWKDAQEQGRVRTIPLGIFRLR